MLFVVQVVPPALGVPTVPATATLSRVILALDAFHCVGGAMTRPDGTFNPLGTLAKATVVDHSGLADKVAICGLPRAQSPAMHPLTALELISVVLELGPKVGVNVAFA